MFQKRMIPTFLSSILLIAANLEPTASAHISDLNLLTNPDFSNELTDWKLNTKNSGKIQFDGTHLFLRMRANNSLKALTLTQQIPPPSPIPEKTDLVFSADLRGGNLTKEQSSLTLRLRTNTGKIEYVLQQQENSSDFEKLEGRIPLPKHLISIDFSVSIEAGASGILDVRSPRVALAPSASIPPLSNSPKKSETLRLRVRPQINAPTLTPLHFGVNVVNTWPGLYFGTLPASHPKSSRIAFAESLEKAGIRSFRFPGGNEVYPYFPESKKDSQELRAALGIGRNGPNYWTTAHDIIDFCKEYDIQLIYQISAHFYSDPEEGPIAIRKNNMLDKAPRANLYKGDRLPQATAALERLFTSGLFVPGDVDCWEIDNESFVHMDAQDYAEICASFIQVLNKYDPGRPITIDISGQKGFDILESAGVMQHLTGLAKHYPFTRYPAPSNRKNTADYHALATSWMNIKPNLDATAENLSRMGYPDLRQSISETGVYKYDYFEGRRMTCSYAHALAYALNWPDLVSHNCVDMAIFHDLESSYFGMLQYGHAFYKNRRSFWYMPEGIPKGHISGTESFMDQYFISPTAYANGLLAEFVGAQIHGTELTPGKRLGILAGTKNAYEYLFLANPHDEPVILYIDYPALTDATGWQVRTIKSQDVYSVLENEYSREEHILSSLPTPITLEPFTIMLLRSM